MEKDIQQFERIRSYIKGKMSIEDAASFERDLLHDKELYAEYEVLKDISQAVVKVNSEEELRALLAKAESEHVNNPIAVDKKALKEDLAQVERDLIELDRHEGRVTEDRPILLTFFEKVRAWFTPGAIESEEYQDGTRGLRLSYVSRLAVTAVIAASLAIAVILPVNNHHMAVAGYEEAGRILGSNSWQFGAYRGDDDISDMLNTCYEEIQEEKYQDALNTINNTEVAIEKQISQLSGDDSAVLRLAELERARQDAAWIKAVLLMKEKEVGKAKRLLKTISASESTHSQDAERILKEIY